MSSFLALGRVPGLASTKQATLPLHKQRGCKVTTERIILLPLLFSIIYNFTFSAPPPIFSLSAEEEQGKKLIPLLSRVKRCT
jgi:hypothetical protein